MNSYKKLLPMTGGAMRRLMYYYKCTKCAKERQTVNRKKADFRVKGSKVCGVCKRNAIDPNQTSLL